MADLTIRYGVSRKVRQSRIPGTFRPIEVQRGELRVPGGVYLDDDTWAAIKAKVHELHPGWSLMGINYLTGPADEHVEHLDPYAYVTGPADKHGHNLNPDPNWLQEADEEIEEKGTEGAFTRQARRAGYSDTLAYARLVVAGYERWVHSGKRGRSPYTLRTYRRASFAINAQKRNPGAPMRRLDFHINKLSKLDQRFPDDGRAWGDVDLVGAVTAATRVLPDIEAWLILAQHGDDNDAAEAAFQALDVARRLRMRLQGHLIEAARQYDPA